MWDKFKDFRKFSSDAAGYFPTPYKVEIKKYNYEHFTFFYTYKVVTQLVHSDWLFVLWLVNWSSLVKLSDCPFVPVTNPYLGVKHPVPALIDFPARLQWACHFPTCSLLPHPHLLADYHVIPDIRQPGRSRGRFITIQHRCHHVSEQLD